ncbi:dihydrodipicolinate synthase family protein [Streptomyces sp. F63]|nr:dihydrodipicolinate synthase family protein [Streptomyces sp. F63]
MVATATPLRADLSVDFEAYAEHVRQLIDSGCDGVVPNGSLGEYQTLSDDERGRPVTTAVEAAGDGARVMAGVAAYGSAEARRWTDQAAGAVGWIAGFPNALPEACSTLYRTAAAGNLEMAIPLYRAMHPLLRWDSRPEFVQAVKLSMDVAGLRGGPCRPPRSPLPSHDRDTVRAVTEKLLAEGLS